MLDGDLATGRDLLRHCIDATTGYPALAETLAISIKSKMRMFAPDGNHTAATSAPTCKRASYIKSIESR